MKIYQAITIVLLASLVGCDSELKQRVKIAELGMKMGYECKEKNITEEECFGILSTTLIKAL